MPKPVKIKKKKSFMFTTKHHSFLGVLGAVVAVITAATAVFVVYESFMNRGKTTANLGGMGMFAAIANILGIICGVLALNERDIHRWLPIVDIIVNIVILAAWILCVALGMRG